MRGKIDPVRSLSAVCLRGKIDPVHSLSAVFLSPGLFPSLESRYFLPLDVRVDDWSNAQFFPLVGLLPGLVLRPLIILPLMPPDAPHV